MQRTEENLLHLTNIDGEPDTAYAYGNERLTVERFTGWTGYYTYDPRGSVSGVTDADGGLWASYRYNATGRMTFGEPEYNQIYGYNGESYNPMLELQYLRARYYDVERGNFLTEDTYLGDISDPLTLNRYNYVKSNPLNYIDPSGFVSEYLTGPSYDPDDSWKANNYPLSQTGSEKTEFPVTVVSGIKAVRELWGSVSKGVANAANMISENVSHAVKNKVKDLMETAVKASVMIVCSDTVQLLNDVGNTIFSFIIGTVYGALEPASVLLDFLIDSGGYDSAAFELGRIVGNAAAVAAIFGMFFAGGGVISGAFMGGAMALSLGAAGAATVELAAGATVIAAKGNSIAEALNSLISEMSGASNSGGKGTEEEGDSEAKSIDDILDGAEETTNNAGIARNFEKTGGYEKTLEDFNALQPSNVKDIQTQYGPGKVGYLEDGTTVVARPGSKTGGATLEIKISNKKIYKIRY